MYYKRTKSKRKFGKKIAKKFIQNLNNIFFGFWHSLDPKIFDSDIIHTLARSYYLRMAILMVILDITILVKIFFNFKFIFLTVPLTFLSIKAFYNFLANITCIAFNKHYLSVITEQPRAECSSGAPGSGKSSNEAYKVVELAKWQWKQLQQEYWFYLSKDRNKLSQEKQSDYDEIVFAYKFEIAHPDRIHCLWSNIPISIGNHYKLKSYKLTRQHLTQQKKLPYRAVLFTDEIGSMYPATKGPTINDLENLSTLARWIRQFLEAFWSFTEQEFSKTFVDVRRVTGSNKYFKSQVWTLKPNFLLLIYNLLLSIAIIPLSLKRIFKPEIKVQNFLDKWSILNSKLFSKPLRTFKRYIKSIGWRHYKYTELGNSEVNDKVDVETKIKSIYLPSCLNCYYDDRAFRNAYLAIDFDIQDSYFVSDKLSKSDIKELFGKT